MIGNIMQLVILVLFAMLLTASMIALLGLVILAGQTVWSAVL